MDSPHKTKTVNMRRQVFLRRAWPLATVLTLVTIYLWFGWGEYLTFDALNEHRESLLKWTRDNRILAVTLFVIGYALVVACSLPGATCLTLGGGFVFGTFLATLAVVASATLGAVFIFLIARYTLADFFKFKVGSLGQRLETGFREDALNYLLFLRLVPVFPFWVVNIVPAFAGVPLRVYIVGTFVGIIPGSAVYCSIGNGLGSVFETHGRPDIWVIFEPQFLVPIIALAALSLIPVVYKRIRTYKE